MFGFFKKERRFILLFLLIFLMTLISIFIYFKYLETKNSIFKIIKEHLINEKVLLFKNYSAYIVSYSGKNLKEDISKNKELAHRYEEELRLLKGNEIQYLYLLYKDKDEKFRFLLDTTLNLEQKAEFNQKFDPETDIWSRAYETKTVQVTQQKGLETLWVSIAYPLVVDGEVIAVVGADFTYKVYAKIVKTLKPLESVYFYVSVFMVIMLSLAYLLIYLYYKTRKTSFIDPLTQVYNRQFLYEFKEQNLLQNYHLMMIDIDHFKKINDTYGHNVGDEVLIVIVQEMKFNIRENDIIIRFGGEEFIILVHKNDLNDFLFVANRIREAIMNRIIFTQNDEINMTISIGINPFPERARNIEEAIKVADEQLYKAKISGRNRVEVFHENDKVQVQTKKRITDIQFAIDDNRIKCAFQPIYSSKTKKIIKYEMLIRMIDINGNIVPPNEFLPSIRHTQVYINLTRIVVDIAIKTLKENNFNLAINLDIQDIINEDILKLLKNKFENEAELAARLTIEILEHEEITNFKLIKERIAILKELGFTIALDDFGSGYANFRYLLDLNIDILKIDGTIIQNIDKDKAAYNIVKSIVDFAKSMNMEIVAEQIETAEELRTVSELGIDYLQGYYLGRPLFEFVQET